MNMYIRRYEILAVLLLMIALVSTSAALVPPAAAASVPQRLLIEANSAADFSALAADMAKSGIQVVKQFPEINMMVVLAPATNGKEMVARNPRVAAVAPDRIESLVRPEMQAELFGKEPSSTATRTRVAVQGYRPAPRTGSIRSLFTADPAFTLTGLMWNVNRVHALQAWDVGHGMGEGFQSVKVAVMDTGLDYTHIELKNKVDKVVDFTVNEQPNICSTFFGGPTDAQLAVAFGAPSADLDFNGHGSWIGGNIAASLNMTGTNGIVPGVQLVALKISQNCGSAYDSTMIDALLYAANNSIPIVSVSFGGYLDRTDPAQNLIYRFWRRAVNYALARGTLMIAAAGNEHTRIGSGGLVVSHGILSVGSGGEDLFGMWESPGGIPGVIDVSSTGNIVNAASLTCPADSLAAGNHAWCKPSTDAHQPFGVGKMNQLTYYSNYGPRIDFSAPGGARKFNVPAADRGGCEGWPWCGTISVEGGSSVADGFNAWEDFSITSNWAVEIPCFTFTSDLNFPDNNCYAIIQGTSMATPHVSAIAAIALSTHPEALNNPTLLLTIMKMGAIHLTGNTTPPVSKTDTSPGDLSGVACTNGYCHLGGLKVPDLETYGKYGFLDALKTALVP